MIQAAKSVLVISSREALINVLDSIGRFVGRLKTYTEIPLSSAMVEIVVEIMVELISLLALETKKFMRRGLSESAITNVLCYSVRCSQICQETLGRQGREHGYSGGPTEIGPTHAIRASECRSSDSQSCLR